jgi:RNA polymerase sigma-70 factor (ECF subfamily)
MNTFGPMAGVRPLAPEENEMESHERTERCKEVFSLLSEYLNLELPPDACQEIETHLAGCPPCIEFAESLRKTVDLCRHYQPTELPEPIGKQAREQLLDAYGKMLAGRKTTP